MHLDRNCWPKGFSRHRGGSQPILCAPTWPFQCQPLVLCLPATLLHRPSHTLMAPALPAPADSAEGASDCCFLDCPSGAGRSTEVLRGYQGRQPLLAPTVQQQLQGQQWVQVRPVSAPVPGRTMVHGRKKFQYPPDDNDRSPALVWLPHLPAPSMPSMFQALLPAADACQVPRMPPGGQ